MFSHKQSIALPKRIDEYTLRFWFASLEASWKGQLIRNGWDIDRLNWPYLLWAASFHRVLASFGHVWEEVKGLPESVWDEIWVAREMAGQRGEAAIMGIRDLSGISQQHSLRLVLIKSASYLLDAFSSFRDREMLDIDVLALPQDAEILSQELRRLGYEFQELRSQRVFRRGKVVIEVHLEAISRKRFWRLLPPARLLECSEANRRWPPLLNLSPSDEAILLALHAYHHHYRQAIWLRDLAAWWRVRNPDPSEILTAFKQAQVTRIGWGAWRGIERMGWKIPESWHPQQWGVKSTLDRFVCRYWDRDAFRTSTSLRLVLLRRWLEFHQAQGAVAKLMVCSPWFTLRSQRELYRAWKGVER